MGQEQFINWVREKLVPELGEYKKNQPRSVVILDNASTHHDDEVVRLIEGVAKAKILYTARYSPDLNPMEYYFKMYRYALKRHEKLGW